jgi:hypothetical protein
MSTQWIFGIASVTFLVLVLIVILLPRIEERRREQRYEREELARVAAERARIAALPELDTSEMLEIPLSLGEMEESRNDGGTFGNRYVHMLVTDRDGRRYTCFMTEHNLRSLSRSEFQQAGYSPLLREHGEDVMIEYHDHEERINVWPAWLERFLHTSSYWRRWAELHYSFRQWRTSGGVHHDCFTKYFDRDGRPRQQVSESAKVRI